MLLTSPALTDQTTEIENALDRGQFCVVESHPRTDVTGRTIGRIRRLVSTHDELIHAQLNCGVNQFIKP